MNLRTTGRSRAAVSAHLHVDYLAELRLAEDIDTSTIMHRCNRLFALIFGCLTCVDTNQQPALSLGRSSDTWPDSRGTRSFNWRRLISLRAGTRFSEQPLPSYYWTSDLILALYHLFSAHLLVNLYYQYSYDFDRMRLAQLRSAGDISEMVADSESASPIRCSAGEFGHATTDRPHPVSLDRSRLNSSTQLQLALEHRLNNTRASLEAVGAPYAHLSMVVECAHLFVLLCAFLVFYLSHVLYRLCRPFDLHTVRSLLNYRSERLNTRQLVEAKVLEFIESGELFEQVLADHVHRQLTNSSTSTASRVQHRFSNPPPMNITLQQLFRDPRIGWANIRTGSEVLVEEPGGTCVMQLASDARNLRSDQILMQLLSSGALMPYNESIDWFERRSLAVFAHQLGTGTYGSTFFFYVIVNFVANCNLTRDLTLADCLMLTSVLGLVLMIMGANSFFGTCFLSAYLDQIFYVEKIETMAKRCIWLNFSHFEALIELRGRRGLAPPASPVVRRTRRASCVSAIMRTGQTVASTKLDSPAGELNDNKRDPGHQRHRHHHLHRRTSGSCLMSASFSPTRSPVIQELPEPRSATSAANVDECALIDCMNTNLIFILMHYKIFIAQFLPVRRTCESQIVFITGILLLIPSIIKLHLPYFRQFNMDSLRVGATILSATILVPANLVTFPLCYMHSRCVRLYRVMSSLMAHVIEIESCPGGRGLYEQHAVLKLLKELRHPDKFIDQFRPRLAGMSGTFNTLVKVHFWWGLIVLSIMFDIQTNTRSLLDSLFADPLGVFAA